VDHHSNDAIVAKLKQHIRELKENQDNLIELIEVSDDCVWVETKEIVTDEAIEGHKRLIGRMAIRIDMAPIVGEATSSAHPVKITNLDRRFNTGEGSMWECGHVSSPDEICWGTGFEQLFDAFASRDLHAILDVIIRFIKNPNLADGWGSHVAQWPEYQSGGLLIETR